MASASGKGKHPERIILRGAPDKEIGNKEIWDREVQQKLPQSLLLQLDKETVEQLRKFSTTGRKIEISFGKTPVLEFGEDSRSLSVSPARFRSEIYEPSTNIGDTLQFKSIVTHQMALDRARAQIKSTEEAHATLAARMKEERQRREDNSLTILEKDTEAGKRANLVKRKPNFMRPLNHQRPTSSQSTRSLHSSPSLSAYKMPSSSADRLAPTSAPSNLTETQQRTQAQKHTLSHLLAVRPASKQELSSKTKVWLVDVAQFLTRHGKAVPDTSLFELNERSYRDLDIWSFKYASEDDRLSAQANAIRAFDRLRISKDDKVWQALLPLKDRNKGIVLSKLHLNGPPQGSSTPQMPSDHRKLLAGAGGEVTNRPRTSSGSNLQRVMNGKKPLSGKASPNAAVKTASSPKPGESAKAGETKKKVNSEPAKKASSAKKTETKEYKSAEFVYDDDDDLPEEGEVEEEKGLSDVETKSAEANVKVNNPRDRDENKLDAQHKDKNKTDANKVGTKRKAEEDHTAGRVMDTSSAGKLASKPLVNGAKRARPNDSPPVAVGKGSPPVRDVKSLKSNEANARATTNNAQNRNLNNAATAGTRPKAGSLNGVGPSPSKNVSSPRASSSANKTSDTTGIDRSKTSTNEKRSIEEKKVQGAGATKAEAKSQPLGTNKQKPLPVSTTRKRPDPYEASKPVATTVKQSSTPGNHKLAKTTTGSSSSSVSSTISSTSTASTARTSVYSPAATPKHRHTNSSSSLAAYAPAPVIKRVKTSELKTSELKRPASSKDNHGSTSTKEEALLSSGIKRRKLDVSGPPSSSSSPSPASNLTRNETPLHSRDSPSTGLGTSPPEPSSSEKPKDGRRSGTLVDDEARLNAGDKPATDVQTPLARDNSDHATTPLAKGISPQDTSDSEPVDTEQIAKYHSLQASYLPLFKDSMHLSVSFGSLPAHLMKASDTDRIVAAVESMTAVHSKLKSLLSKMSPATLRSTGQSPSDIAEKVRRDQEAQMHGHAYQWDVVPDNWHVDQVLGFEAFARAHMTELKTEYTARKDAWDANVNTKSKAGKKDTVALIENVDDLESKDKLEYEWLFRNAILIQQWELVSQRV